MVLHVLLQILVLAVATSAISLTTALSKLFGSARGWITRRSRLLGELVGCHYCTSHWVSFALCAIYRPEPVHQFWLIDYFVGAFCVIGCSALLSGHIHSVIPFRGGYPGDGRDDEYGDPDSKDP